VRRFAFRLDNVLRIRKKLEEAAQRDFARSLGELLDAKSKLERAAERLRTFIKEHRIEGGVFTAAEIVMIDNYIALVKKNIQELRAVKEEKEREMNRLLLLLKEAKKARKLMENLKARKLERYMEELNREETVELDDVTQKMGLNREKLTVEDSLIEDM
jgi:flagellar export protein FliJ